MTGRRRPAHGRRRAAAARLALERRRPAHRAVCTQCVSPRRGVRLLRSELLVLRASTASPARAAPPAPARHAAASDPRIPCVPRCHGRERGGVHEPPLGRAAAVQRPCRWQRSPGAPLPELQIPSAAGSRARREERGRADCGWRTDEKAQQRKSCPTPLGRVSPEVILICR
jgi:hypothetical protein